MFQKNKDPRPRSAGGREQISEAGNDHDSNNEINNNNHKNNNDKNNDNNGNTNDSNNDDNNNNNNNNNNSNNNINNTGGKRDASSPACARCARPRARATSPGI